MRFVTLRLQLQSLFALAAITAATGCTTMNGYTMNSSGMSYYEQGNYVAAANEFQQAAMANPANPDYIANFAKARMKLGDTQGAEQLYRQALSIAPSHQPSYHGLAESMLAQGREQEAASLLTAWAGTQPYIAESHVELAWLQREMGQNDAAAESLQRALQVNPGHSTALAHLGQYYEENGRADQAVALYQQSLRGDWNQPEVHSRIASAAQSAGPASPMAATAMARGVHPYSVPRQQTAFGPPSRGAQMAQMRMAQTQMAMAGNPMYGGMAQPGMTTNQRMMMSQSMNGRHMAAAPHMNDGTMSTYYSPNSMAIPQGWQSADAIINQPMDPNSAMSFGTTLPSGISSNEEWSFESTTSDSPTFEVPQKSSTNTAIAPTPDPAFSLTHQPQKLTNASWSPSQSATPLTGPTSNGTPLVEAF